MLTSQLTVLRDFWPLVMLAIVGAVLATAYYWAVKPGELLSFWAKWVNKCYERFCITGVGGPSGDADRLTRHQWMLKPILTCERCIGGQFGFWLSMLAIINGGYMSLLSTLFVVTLTSLLSSLIVKEFTR